jgi:tRNA A22 N-methylase
VAVLAGVGVNTIIKVLGQAGDHPCRAVVQAPHPSLNSMRNLRNWLSANRSDIREERYLCAGTVEAQRWYTTLRLDRRGEMDSFRCPTEVELLIGRRPSDAEERRLRLELARFHIYWLNTIIADSSQDGAGAVSSSTVEVDSAWGAVGASVADGELSTIDTQKHWRQLLLDEIDYEAQS